MTRNETVQLLRKIYLSFSTTWLKLSKDDADEMVDMWFEECRKIPYQGLIEALSVYKLRGEKYPPGSGELINIFLRTKFKVENAEKSYDRLQKAVSNSGRNAVEEYNNLSYLEKKIVASPSELKRYADDETGAFTRYKKAYIDRYNELLADPITFSHMIEEMNKPQITVETKQVIEEKVEDKSKEKTFKFILLFVLLSAVGWIISFFTMSE